ncbi:MAG: hypothetical protein JW936_03880 [Sedimentisphaerales bacterium]|nr:hypothetical protein [Sedimentisphaerales bacterium]
MNTKAKGNRLEHKAIKLLESVGYQCMRSAASLGPFDILAMNRLGMRCIQVKANAWPRPEERETLEAAGKNLPSNALIECWRWNDRAREPLIKQLDEFV